MICVGWLYERFLSGFSFSFTENWSNTSRVIAGLFLSDFLSWFHHYVRHKIPVLWKFHAVHHSQTQMNPFTDYRAHFIEYLVAKPVVLIPLLMLHLPVEYAIGIVIFQRCYTLAYHANLKTNYGVLRYILVTPQSHRIHHSILERHSDKNFGVILCIWDRIFGTHCSDAGAYPAVGVRDPDFPMENDPRLLGAFKCFVRQNVYPFQQIFRRRTLSRPGVGCSNIGSGSDRSAQSG